VSTLVFADKRSDRRWPPCCNCWPPCWCRPSLRPMVRHCHERVLSTQSGRSVQLYQW